MGHVAWCLAGPALWRHVRWVATCCWVLGAGRGGAGRHGALVGISVERHGLEGEGG